MPDRFRNLPMMPIKGTFNADCIARLEVQNERWASLFPKEILWHKTAGDYHGTVQLAVNKRLLSANLAGDNFQELRQIHERGGVNAPELLRYVAALHPKHKITHKEDSLSQLLTVADKCMNAYEKLLGVKDAEARWAGKFTQGQIKPTAGQSVSPSR